MFGAKVSYKVGPTFVFSVLVGVFTPVITGRGPPCRSLGVLPFSHKIEFCEISFQPRHGRGICSFENGVLSTVHCSIYPVLDSTIGFLALSRNLLVCLLIITTIPRATLKRIFLQPPNHQFFRHAPKMIVINGVTWVYSPCKWPKLWV